MSTTRSESLESFFKALSGSAWRNKVLEWPPDVFGLAGAVLARTGAYLAVISKWPPTEFSGDKWQKDMRRIGRAWASNWRSNNKRPPNEVRVLWRIIVNNSTVRLTRLSAVNYSEVAAGNGSRAQRVCKALLQIMAIADEACYGLGIPDEHGDFKRGGMEEAAIIRLYHQFAADEPSTLCLFIDPVKLSVLPKLHTPQSGITIRSLSNYLALCFGSEVHISWVWGRPLIGEEQRHGLNLLILPWPDIIVPADFSPAHPPSGRLPAMSKSHHGFFCFRVSGKSRWNLARLKAVFGRARTKVNVIDAIIFPELAITEKDLATVARYAQTIRPCPPMIIAGVAAPHKGDRIKNISVTLIPYELPGKGKKFRYARFVQAKHHRWKLDSRQIEQYGIGGILDPSFSWWENSSLPPRSVIFICINPWLTMCTLLCEDLARPDPIADIVRAVGPNLVVALLLDGPQLASRWPARYGTVLADDPGSSVLTVTNLGMAELSRTRAKPESVSRVVALWKDAHCGAPIEIPLPQGKDAIVLCVTRKECTEFTADGRHDNSSAAHMNLSGVHAV